MPACNIPCVPSLTRWLAKQPHGSRASAEPTGRVYHSCRRLWRRPDRGRGIRRAAGRHCRWHSRSARAASGSSVAPSKPRMRTCPSTVVAVLAHLVDIDHRRRRTLDPLRRRDAPITPHTALQHHHADAGQVTRRQAQAGGGNSFALIIGKPFRRPDAERIEQGLARRRAMSY